MKLNTLYITNSIGGQKLYQQNLTHNSIKLSQAATK